MSPDQRKSGLFWSFYDLFKANLSCIAARNFQADRCEIYQSWVKSGIQPAKLILNSARHIMLKYYQ